jgi:hypothetical protein
MDVPQRDSRLFVNTSTRRTEQTLNLLKTLRPWDTLSSLTAIMVIGDVVCLGHILTCHLAVPVVAPVLVTLQISRNNFDNCPPIKMILKYSPYKASTSEPYAQMGEVKGDGCAKVVSGYWYEIKLGKRSGVRSKLYQLGWSCNIATRMSSPLSTSLPSTPTTSTRTGYSHPHSLFSKNYASPPTSNFIPPQDVSRAPQRQTAPPPPRAAGCSNVNHPTLPHRASAPPGRIRPLPPLPTSRPPASAPPVSTTIRPLPSIPRVSVVSPSPPNSPPPSSYRLLNPHPPAPSPSPTTTRPLPDPHSPLDANPIVLLSPRSPVESPKAGFPEYSPLTITRRSKSAFSSVPPLDTLSVISTSPSTLHCRSSISSSIASSLFSPLSPLTPSILLRKPTLTTAKRKSLAKVQRFLGEIVPVELVMGPSSATERRRSRLSLAKAVSARADLHIWKKKNQRRSRNLGLEQKPRIARTKKDGDDNGEPESTSPAGGEDRSSTKTEKKPELDTNGNQLRSSYTQRTVRESLNKAWLRERGGRRYVENNFHNVLSALRSL